MVAEPGTAGTVAGVLPAPGRTVDLAELERIADPVPPAEQAQSQCGLGALPPPPPLLLRRCMKTQAWSGHQPHDDDGFPSSGTRE